MDVTVRFLPLVAVIQHRIALLSVERLRIYGPSTAVDPSTPFQSPATSASQLIYRLLIFIYYLPGALKRDQVLRSIKNI